MTRFNLKQQEPFQFALAIRRLLPDLPEWNVSEGDGSLRVYFSPVRRDTKRLLDVEIDAEFWVAREKRVSFAFWSGSEKARSPQFQSLKQKLADDFREYLWNQDVPEFCAKSAGATVLHVPVQDLDEESAKKVIVVFTFLRNNISKWHSERFLRLISEAHSQPDALDDLDQFNSSYTAGQSHHNFPTSASASIGIPHLLTTDTLLLK